MKFIDLFRVLLFLFCSRCTVYGKGQEDSIIEEDWENSYSEILDSSIEPRIKSEQSLDMYDDDNYSESSNID